MEVKAVKRITVTEQIMEQIAVQITEGKLKPGEKLPNEREFAQMFQVTRNRVREALRALSLIGMITIKPGGGSFVSEKELGVSRETVTWMSHRELSAFDDLYAARKLIETEVYLCFFDGRSDEAMEEIKALMNDIEEAADSPRSNPDFLGLLDKLDLFVGKNCGNGILYKLMQTMVLLRYDLSLKILGLEGSRSSAVILRRRVVNALAGTERQALELALERFFADSLNKLEYLD